MFKGYEKLLKEMNEAEIDKILDAMFGKQEDVVVLIKEGKWKEASKFGDGVCYNAVINNEDWIWKQIEEINEITSEWNSCTYGGIAMAVHYGRKFPERAPIIEKLKKLFE